LIEKQLVTKTFIKEEVRVIQQWGHSTFLNKKQFDIYKKTE
jgi:hypothetical protein